MRSYATWVLCLGLAVAAGSAAGAAGGPTGQGHGHDHSHEHKHGQSHDDDHGDTHGHDHGSGHDHGEGAEASGGEAAALGAHVHGLAELTIARDGGTVELAFTSAMWNLVGFERAPETEAEVAALEAAAAALDDPLSLFGLPAAAECAVTAAAPGLTPTAVAGGTYDTGDLSAQWTLQCTAAGRLTALRPRLFEAFAQLETVDAAYIGERQRAATLTRARPDFQVE